MQTRKTPLKRYKDLKAEGRIPDEAIQELSREGSTWPEISRAIAADAKQAVARSLQFLVDDDPAAPLPRKSYNTLREIIVGMIRKKVPPKQEATSLIKASLSKTHIVVEDREIATILNEDSDEQAGNQAVLGVLLALAMDLFRYNPDKKYQAAITNIKKAVYGDDDARTEDTIRSWLNKAAERVPRQG